jgi:hypothetical protein
LTSKHGNSLAQEYDKFSLMLDGIGGTFPAYSYMAYLRHHGFPSPMLDWPERLTLPLILPFEMRSKKGSQFTSIWSDPAVLSLRLVPKLRFTRSGLTSRRTGDIFYSRALTPSAWNF